MIKRVRATRFGCLRDFESTELTPIHAFIGPNGSGKSTILRLVRTVVDLPFAGEKDQQAWADLDALAGTHWSMELEGEGGRKLVVTAQGSALRLDITADQSYSLRRGESLAALADPMSKLLGGVGSRLMRNVDYQAILALESLSPVACLFFEEPESGLHPARIREVVRVLRRISERGTQVLMATHSPLVVNELMPDEVTIAVRPRGESPRLTRLCDTPHFEARSKVYALGELWLSYADGDLEKALLEPVPVS